MAQSNWKTVTTTENNYQSTVSGSGVQHNSLTNPITGSEVGIWCRGFQSSGPGLRSCGVLIPKDNAILTSSVGYPYGYTYSLRCWMRIANANSFDRPSSLALCFKGDQTLSAQNFSNNMNLNYTSGIRPGFVRGYSLILSDWMPFNSSVTSGVKLTLRCASDVNSLGSPNNLLDSANNNNAYTSGDLINANESPPPYGSFAPNWRRFRMDITSLPDGDKITIFTGNLSNTWSQLHQVTIPRQKTGAYVPWNSNPLFPSDDTGAATAGHMGIIHYNGTNVTSNHIDRFEVFREVIP